MSASSDSAPPVESTRARTSPSPPRPNLESPADDHYRARDVRVTVLSTSRADVGIGEWGFSAVVEVDGHRILFDTGAGSQTVLRNAEAAGVDLSSVTELVLSHHHDDHVGGLLALRRSVASKTPQALAKVHVARGMFEPRRFGTKTREVNDMIEIRPAYERTGGQFVVHDQAEAIAPGVWVTGPVPRRHPEHNWSGSRTLRSAEGWVEDRLPESQALVIDSEDGLVVLSGCGHAGIVNIVAHAQASIRAAAVQVIGGFHLHRATAGEQEWTMQQLQRLGLTALYGAHCTGSKAVREAARHIGADRVDEIGVGWQLQLARP